MTDTEIMLLAVHRSPLIPLAAICKAHFNLSPAEAAREAAFNRMPVPVFRLRVSNRAPYMVHVRDLAAFADSRAADAARSWERSQT